METLEPPLTEPLNYILLVINLIDVYVYNFALFCYWLNNSVCTNIHCTELGMELGVPGNKLQSLKVALLLVLNIYFILIRTKN